MGCRSDKRIIGCDGCSVYVIASDHDWTGRNTGDFALGQPVVMTFGIRWLSIVTGQSRRQSGNYIGREVCRFDMRHVLAVLPALDR